MKFCVVNLGCKVNRVESDAFESVLISKGFEASNPENSDLVIINTCTVTGEAEKKTRKAVRQMLRAGHAKVAVTGCAAAIHPDEFKAMGERVDVIAKADMHSYLDEFCEERSGHSCNPILNRARQGVKVQDGCDNACTYCIVHVARGKSISRSVEEILADCKKLARNNVKEIVLTGINLGSYRKGQTGLNELLEIVLEGTEHIHDANDFPSRFRLSSIEPGDIDEETASLIANSNGRICRHLHLPLQSGSNKVLREMARLYDASEYVEQIDLLRSYLPTLSLTTDIIVGFPGETDEDFSDTLAISQRCGFSKIHVFPYSIRENTPAASRTDQIAPEIKATRAKTLRDLSNALRKRDYDARVGTHESAVFETATLACTESYHEVLLAEHHMPGSLAQIVIPASNGTMRP